MPVCHFRTMNGCPHCHYLLANFSGHMYGQYPDQHDGGDGDDQPDEDDGEGMVRVVMMMMMAVVVMFSQLTRLSCSVK